MPFMLPPRCDTDPDASEPASPALPSSSYAWAERRLSKTTAFAAANWDNPKAYKAYVDQGRDAKAKLKQAERLAKRMQRTGIAGRRNSMRGPLMSELSPFSGGIFQEEMSTNKAVQQLFIRRLNEGTFDYETTCQEVEATSERPQTASSDLREDSIERPMSKTSASSEPLRQPQRPMSQPCLRPNSAQAPWVPGAASSSSILPGESQQSKQATLQSFSQPLSSQYPNRSMSKIGGLPHSFQYSENGTLRPHSAPTELWMNPGMNYPSSPSRLAMSSKPQSERESPAEDGSRHTSKGSGLEWVAQRLSKAAAVAASNWDNPKVYQDYISRERLAKEAERKGERRRQKLLAATVAAFGRRNSVSREAFLEGIFNSKDTLSSTQTRPPSLDPSKEDAHSVKLAVSAALPSTSEPSSPG